MKNPEKKLLKPQTTTFQKNCRKNELTLLGDQNFKTTQIAVHTQTSQKKSYKYK